MCRLLKPDSNPGKRNKIVRLISKTFSTTIAAKVEKIFIKDSKVLKNTLQYNNEIAVYFEKFLTSM